MPGLGWILKRSLWSQELEPRWPTPDKTWDWDMWMRLPEIRRGRECVVPEVSRTYHFGSSGLNMNSYFHDIYFTKHSVNTVRDVELSNVDSVKKEQYEERLEEEMRGAVVLNSRAGGSPCDEQFYTDLQATAGLLFISMEHAKDFSSWLSLAKCLHVWDLDARGFHRGMWRLHMSGSQVFIIGAPFSPYSRYMPQGLQPLVMKKPEQTQSKEVEARVVKKSGKSQFKGLKSLIVKEPKK